MAARPYMDAATPGVIGLMDAAYAVDDGGRGEVRPRHQAQEGRFGEVRLLDQRHQGVGEHLVAGVGQRHASAVQDPMRERVEPAARRLARITFEEMLEMASLGSKVLQIRAVEFAGKYNVPLRVLSSFEEGEGTLITYEEEGMEQALISGIAFNRDEAKLTVLGVPDQPGVAHLILGPVADANIEVDMIIQRLDRDSSGIVNQARIVKLKNTLAADLAVTLQNAISAASGSAPGSDAGSTVLELLTADVQGQRLLRSGVLSDVQITPDPHTNSLMVAAPAESMGLVAALMIVFPISKLLHAPGVFFSPTRNHVDNPREQRHLAPWAAKLESGE